jgi:hypothetical protein
MAGLNHGRIKNGTASGAVIAFAVKVPLSRKR